MQCLLTFNESWCGNFECGNLSAGVRETVKPLTTISGYSLGMSISSSAIASLQNPQKAFSTRSERISSPSAISMVVHNTSTSNASTSVFVAVSMTAGSRPGGSGLSTGAKVGIGLSAFFGAIIAGVLVLVFHRLPKRSFHYHRSTVTEGPTELETKEEAQEKEPMGDLSEFQIRRREPEQIPVELEATDIRPKESIVVQLVKNTNESVAPEKDGPMA